MKNKLAVISLAIALVTPTVALWAAAGDSTISGTNGTTTGAPAPSVKGGKKHHGHHHKKTTAPAATTAPATK